nr:hypothetical protein Iba_chr03eCG0680 [Ipomoea batatas]
MGELPKGRKIRTTAPVRAGKTMKNTYPKDVHGDLLAEPVARPPHDGLHTGNLVPDLVDEGPPRPSPLGASLSLADSGRGSLEGRGAVPPPDEASKGRSEGVKSPAWTPLTLTRLGHSSPGGWDGEHHRLVLLFAAIVGGLEVGALVAFWGAEDAVVIHLRGDLRGCIGIGVQLGRRGRPKLRGLMMLKKEQDGKLTEYEDSGGEKMLRDVTRRESFVYAREALISG